MSGLAASWSSQCQVAELVQHLSVSWLISSEDSEMETGNSDDDDDVNVAKSQLSQVLV